MNLNPKELVNLTPHPVGIWKKEGIHGIPPSGRVARLHMEDEPAGELTYKGCEVQLILRKPVKVLGLPDPAPGIVFIVSRIVLENSPDRTDLVSPDVKEGVIRDCYGQVEAVTQFLTKKVDGPDTRWR